MVKFAPESSFQTDPSQLILLPFNIERIGSQDYLVSNLVGDFIRLTVDEVSRVVDLELRPGDGLYEKAFAAHLVANRNSLAQKQLLALRLRSRMSYLPERTALHIFVVTLRCEHSCSYCQVSRQNTDQAQFDMTEEVARRSLDIAFQSPAGRIKIEFQGGEPLLNFPLIEKIVTAAKEKSALIRKSVEFVLCSNLSLLTEQILMFCKSNDVLISTSLDGPEPLHNKNRPRRGNDSYKRAVEGIRRAQEVLGGDRVGALMTTTEASLDCPEEIVDEYVRLNLDGVFLRPISPFGFAVKTAQFRRYDAKRWLEFYERGLRRVLTINRGGRPFREFYAALVLTRMLTDKPLGYVDLRSPAGIGLGVLLYNYDGNVFASDEGRMLGEMGDSTFRLGHVNEDDFRALLLSDKLVGLISESMTQCAPMCSTCVFESHCGASPVFHYATQRDALGIKPLSAFCERQKGVMNLLLKILEEDRESASILRSWAS